MLTERYKNCFIFLMFCYLILKKIQNVPLLDIYRYIIYFFIFFTETKEKEIEVEENEKSREEHLLICPDHCLLVIIFKHTKMSLEKKIPN